jgi:macrolide-specific efflux system membrane fusion protein
MASFLRRVRRRTWIIVGAALALVLGGTAVYVFGFAIPGAQQGAQAQSFEVTQQASLQTLEKSVTASGTLTPLVNQTVDFEGSGTVLTVDVAEGQTVMAGQQLATIDTLTLNAALLEAKATLASAQARLASSKSSSSGSTADKAQIAADAAAVEVAQAAVTSAQSALDGAALLAPVAGTITSIGIEVGDTVGSASGNGNANGDGADGDTASAFTIVGTDAWRVDATVGESDVALIAAGDAVHLTTDDGTVLEGTVSEVGMLPSTDSGAAEYPVTIAVDGTAEGLFDGVVVDVEVVYESRDNVLTVPSAAVTTADDGTSTVTVIGTDGTRTETTVEVGEAVGDLTEIVSGIAEGDEVLVAAFTPGEGNDGQIRQLPGGGTFTPPDGAMPGGVMPDGGTITQGGPVQQGSNG